MSKITFEERCQSDPQGVIKDLVAQTTRQAKSIHDLMEAAGLKLKGGLCSLRGEYHIYIDKRKSTADIIDFLNDQLVHPLPSRIPQIDEQAENQNAEECAEPA